MAIVLTKNPDGDLSLGNLRGELTTATFGSSDYVTGGYLIEGIGGNPLTAGNVGMDKVLFVNPVGGGYAGVGVAQTYIPQWNSSTSKLQLFEPSGNGAMVEVAQTTQLLNYSFELLVGGL
jgi:hypothetical protein